VEADEVVFSSYRFSSTKKNEGRNLRSLATNTAASCPDYSGPFCPEYPGAGHPSVQELPSGHAFELRDEHQAEAQVVVTVGGRVAVAVRRTAVQRFVVPRAATYHTVRTLRLMTSRQGFAAPPVLFQQCRNVITTFFRDDISCPLFSGKANLKKKFDPAKRGILSPWRSLFSFRSPSVAPAPSLLTSLQQFATFFCSKAWHGKACPLTEGRTPGGSPGRGYGRRASCRRGPPNGSTA